ncbi:PDZ domain-containing protein [Flavobacterium restrictum]|uniref:PDZ domain-containing protein n=1 Tax=Flavobacterium restrictum TaxID=2594428 RepID=A0A553E904_9FLAO|nr:PDZ domain-containing protein [Flavobacterium restrictum]TRX41412.1 PDZ domain-containing protein [Flavobacterium restrictum]
MKKLIFLFFFLLGFQSPFAQDGFTIDSKLDKVTIPFQLINNLIFIPLQVNGIELTFLLDSGVEETILFSLEDKKDINFYNVEKIDLRGLGSNAAIEGLKSAHNTLDYNGLKSTNESLYVILDQSFNLSAHVGIPVNGIIGYNFFKNNLVEVNYANKKVIVYRANAKNLKKFDTKFEKIPISIERAKPYAQTNLTLNGNPVQAKLLLDIGNSDAIWLFQNHSDAIQVPARNFEDFLGKGFSGDVAGKRAMISQFKIARFQFDNPIVAFPDSSSIKNVKMVPGRLGSVGGEILRRFSLVFDYQQGNLYLKKNASYHAPFTYNKSGIELQQNGMQWVEEMVRLENVPLSSGTSDSGGIKVTHDFKYKFNLKPIYEIGNLRENSPAANAGLLVGDIIITINRTPVHKYSLQKINTLLKSEEEKWITLEIKRGNQNLTFQFQLLNVL